MKILAVQKYVMEKGVVLDIPYYFKMDIYDGYNAKTQYGMVGESRTEIITETDNFMDKVISYEITIAQYDPNVDYSVELSDEHKESSASEFSEVKARMIEVLK